MRKGLLRWIHDPWMLFALLAALLGIGLIIVPQIWILRASLQEAGGKFHLKAEAETGMVTIIPETVERYDLREVEPGVYAVSRQDDLYFSIYSQGDKSLRLEAALDAQFSVAPGEDNTIRLAIRQAEFVISQKVFFSFFDTQTEVTPLKAEMPAPGTLELTFHPNAYIAFHDQRLHYTLCNYATFLSQKSLYQSDPEQSDRDRMLDCAGLGDSDLLSLLSGALQNSGHGNHSGADHHGLGRTAVFRSVCLAHVAGQLWHSDPRASAWIGRSSASTGSSGS